MFDFFNYLPEIPAYDNSIATYVLSVVDVIFHYSLPVLSVIVRLSTLRVIVPLIFFVYYFEFVAKMVIFLLKKIPFLNIS